MRLLRSASVAALLAVSASPLAGPAAAGPARWAVDGGIAALATSGPRLAVGGDFSRIGPYTGPVAAVDEVRGGVRPGLAAIAGDVDAVAPDGLGGVVVAGAEPLAATPRTGAPVRGRVLHLRANGTVRVLPDATPVAVAVGAGRIVVAAAAEEGTRLIGVDLRSGRRLFDRTSPLEVTALAGDARGVVAAVAPGATLARVGADGALGRFGATLVPRATGLLLDGDRVLAWDDPDDDRGVLAEARRADGARVRAHTFVGEVAGVVRSGGAYVVAGELSRLDSRERLGLAALDARTGALLPATAYPAGIAGIEAVAVAPSGRIVLAVSAGGERLLALGPGAPRVVARPLGPVTALVRSAGRLVAVGAFAGADGVERGGVAILRGRGAALGGGIAWPATVDDDLGVRALAWSGARLWVGSTGGGLAVGPLAVVDPRRRGRIVAQPLGRTTADGVGVLALGPAGDGVWAGGDLGAGVPAALVAARPPFARRASAAACGCAADALARTTTGAVVAGSAGSGRWAATLAAPSAAVSPLAALVGAVDVERVGADVVAAGDALPGAVGASVERVGPDGAVRWRAAATASADAAGIADVVAAAGRVVVVGTFDRLAGAPAAGIGVLDARTGRPLRVVLPAGLGARPVRAAWLGAAQVAVAFDDGTLVAIAVP